MERNLRWVMGAMLAACLLLGPQARAADLEQDGANSTADAGTSETTAPAPRSEFQRTVDGMRAEMNSRYIDLVIVRQSLVNVLQAVGEQAKIQITLAKGLSGEISNLRLNGPLRLCLDQIATRAGAVWWWNGKELRMASRRDSTTRTVKTEYATEMMALAKDLGISVGALTVYKAPDMKMVRVSGPPALVADLESLAKDVDTQLSAVKMMKYGKEMNTAAP